MEIESCKNKGCEGRPVMKRGKEYFPLGFCGKCYYIFRKARGKVGRKSSSHKGREKHPLYSAYLSMRGRCYTITNHKYPNYGGRGITICPRWLNTEDGFENFLEDMGPRPEGMTLDRIDNDGNYCPENCRWADCYTQAGNKTTSMKTPGVRQPNKDKQIWEARIKMQGKIIILGYFKSYEEAVTARKEAELKYLGRHL